MVSPTKTHFHAPNIVKNHVTLTFGGWKREMGGVYNYSIITIREYRSVPVHTPTPKASRPYIMILRITRKINILERERET